MKFSKLIPKDWVASALVAIFLHFFMFFGSGFAFVQAPQYGIEASSGGIEVSLIAALPATAEKALPEAKEKNDLEKEEDGEIIEEAQQEQLPATSKKSNAEKKDYSFVNETPFTGDGSSAVPGQSRTTFYSPGGSTTEDKAGYLKNPAPPYPREAVQKGQEGLVVLTVFVDKSGRAQKVEIKKSSNFRLLDDSARKTIKRWKFDPAQMGLLKVDAKVEVPIRFVLEEELKRSRR